MRMQRLWQRRWPTRTLNTCCCCCCLQRVSEVYEQQASDVQDPQLPVESATQLVGHMLNLQAEGLTVAQVGQRPKHLLNWHGHALSYWYAQVRSFHCALVMRVISLVGHDTMFAAILKNYTKRFSSWHCLHGRLSLQGQDPLALLLAARERQFASAMSAAAAEHERSVGRLKAAMASTATEGKLQVGLWGQGAGTHTFGH